MQFAKNLGLFGGLLMIATEGPHRNGNSVRDRVNGQIGHLADLARHKA
jgi:hypothetical protein